MVTIPFTRFSASTTGMARSPLREKSCETFSCPMSSVTVTTFRSMVSLTRASFGAAISSRKETTPSSRCSLSRT